MSFSSDVKTEIINQTGMIKKQRIARLLGMICFGAKITSSPDGYKFKFSTENPKIARTMYSLIKNDCAIKANLRVYRGPKSILYYVMIDDELEINDLFHTIGLLSTGEDIKSFISFHINPAYIMENAEKKAFIGGAFLAAGSVITPQKNCHLEFVTSHYRLSKDMERLLGDFNLNVKTAVRKSNYVLYFKNSSDVADMLTILGAYDALMEYHNIKIMKDVRNSINRKMNCDNANMTKTIDASFRQVEAIKKLEKLGVLQELNESLQEIARLRMQYKELGLKELGEMLNPPLGKSGVNHRLRKLVEEAEKLGDSKE